MKRLEGVSIIICCFNSATRLPETLAHLAHQEVNAGIPWEVIVVDNLSTDNTKTIAEREWNKYHHPAPLRIVDQSIPGQAHARQKGIEVCSFDYVLFCDDDNWLERSYVSRAFGILNSNPRVGACGGKGIPVFEEERAPVWFEEVHRVYATGEQGIEEGVLEQGLLFGAGMATRHSLLRNMYHHGFAPVMKGRLGTGVHGGDDTEIAFVIKNAGYHLYYSQHLVFYHFIEKRKLSREYLESLYVGNGCSMPYNRLYSYYKTHPFLFKLQKWWFISFALGTVSYVKHCLLKKTKQSALVCIKLKANIGELWAMKKTYKTAYQQVKRNIQSLSRTK